MLRVIVEVERGPTREWHRTASFVVFNTHEGDGKNEVYAVNGDEQGRALRRVSIGLVKRNATSPLSLAARGLHALGYIVPEPPKDTDVGRCEARFREWLEAWPVREWPLTPVQTEIVVSMIFGKEKKT